MVLMESVSGIRGVVGEDLTYLSIFRYAQAFGLLQRDRYSPPLDLSSGDRSIAPLILIGRDSRCSGKWIENCIVNVLIAQGYRIQLLEVVSTPTVQFMALFQSAVGAIVVTASHNPIEWNGIKFMDNNSLLLSKERGEKLIKMASQQSLDECPKLTIGLYQNEIRHDDISVSRNLPIETNLQAVKAHVDAILNLKYVNAKEIKKQKFKIVVDVVNGAGGEIMKILLEKLGCIVLILNQEPSGIFSHEPEPIPENLDQLCKAVIENDADFGIAVDPDVDRCVLIDEQGHAIGEEYTLAIAVNWVLSYTSLHLPSYDLVSPTRIDSSHSNQSRVESVGMPFVVKNLSTTRLIDDLAQRYGSEVYTTPVGEVNVVTKIIEVNAIIGGEGNGGVILPELHCGRDAPLASALILASLSYFRQMLSSSCGEKSEGGYHLEEIGRKNLCEKSMGSLKQLVQTFPKWVMVKLKVGYKNSLIPIYEIMDKIKQLFEALKREWLKRDVKISEIDGLKIDHMDFWVHIRPSNTEPIIRIIAEAKNHEEAVRIGQSFLDSVRKYTELECACK